MGQLEQMIAYQNAHGMLENLSNTRAAEMQQRKPNMTRKQILLNTVPARLEGLRGGGKAGLQRIVGGAKKMGRAEEAAEKYMASVENMSAPPHLEVREMKKGRGKLTITHGGGAKDEEVASVASAEKEMKGGFLPALAMVGLPLLSKLFGSGKKRLPRKAAHKMGKELGEHIKQLHGAGFLDDLVSGIGSVVGKMFGSGGAPGAGAAADSGVGSAAKEPAVNVYAKGVAPVRVVPNGLEASAQQAPDYAPKWFRSSGDIAGGGMGSTPAKAKRALSDRQRARNALVKKIMTEKGMKLAEASRYIKENNLS